MPSKKVIGIVGGGQLGRMLTQAAHFLNFLVIVLDPTPNSPAAQVSDKQIVGDYKDENKILELARECDFLTFEIELANSTALEKLQGEGKIINPSPKTLGLIKNKFKQKEFLKNAGLPVADFLEINRVEDIYAAVTQFDYPLVLKAKFDSYDGRGNALIESKDDVIPAMEKLKGQELYVEKFVPFEKELSVLAARAIDGSIAVFPVVETIHKNHICDVVLTPAEISDPAKQQARDLAIKTLGYLKGVGVFAIEMFWTSVSTPSFPTDDLSPKRGLGGVLINEIAPRVHNSGHHTIEACVTSQFEQHIRAIASLELGPTNLVSPSAVMVNILGERTGHANYEAFDGIWEAFAKQHNLPEVSVGGITGIFVHIYGKIETKPERKMGHITVLADDQQTALKAGREARSLIDI